jgi:hypothetical protein
MALYKAYFKTPGFRSYEKEGKASVVPAFRKVADP